MILNRMCSVLAQSVVLSRRDNERAVHCVADIYYDSFENRADVYAKVRADDVRADVACAPHEWLLGWGKNAFPIMEALIYPCFDGTVVLTCRMPSDLFIL